MIPKILQERHSNLEKKYLMTLNDFSDRLRLAAALQANALPQKVIIFMTIF